MGKPVVDDFRCPSAAAPINNEIKKIKNKIKTDMAFGRWPLAMTRAGQFHHKDLSAFLRNTAEN